MRQNKVLLVAQKDERLYQLMAKAIAETPMAPNMVRVCSGDELAAFLMGEDGQQRIVANVPYVLLLDENCSFADGKSLFDKIAANEKLAKMPVIVLLDADSEQRITKYQAIGAGICIIKPDSEDEFVDTITRLANFLAVVQAPLL